MKAVMKEVTHEVGGPAMRLISRTSIPFGLMWLQITQVVRCAQRVRTQKCFAERLRVGEETQEQSILKITCHLSETLTPENTEVSCTENSDRLQT